VNTLAQEAIAKTVLMIVRFAVCEWIANLTDALSSHQEVAGKQLIRSS
jgi:hypothetical protein